MEADVIIRSAQVIDGTGSEGRVADVAVSGERIAAVEDLCAWRAGLEIDGHGKVLCPGFVDMHGHSDYFILVLPGADGKILQGITTEVVGNCGYSAAPVRGDLFEDRRSSHKELYGLEVDWTDFSSYLDRVRSAGPAINLVPLFGFNTVRASAGLYSSGTPDSRSMSVMLEMARESMDAGAFGMSLGLIYPPGAFADAGEISVLAREVAKRGGIVSSHMRSEGDRLIEAIEESAAISRMSGVRFQISHLKTSGPSNWKKLDRAFEVVEAARAEGLDISADRYPYLASFTQLSAALPEWTYEGGKTAFLARLKDKDQRDRMRLELDAADRLGDRWDRIVISQVFKDELKKYESKTVAQGAREAGMDPVDFVCSVVHEARDRAAAVYHTMSEDNLGRIYQKDWVMVGTDGSVRNVSGILAEGKPHPRVYGTMPRMISWVVGEKGWLDLPGAIRKMTFDPCRALGIGDRGIVREGAAADLVLFDPQNIRDKATYDNPQQYPEGIEMVMVNGRVAVRNGELTGDRPGRVLLKE